MTEDLSRLVQWFRRSSPYINAHRGRTVVVSVGGEAMEDGSLPRLVHDLALLNSLGIRVVLVAGARPQVEERLRLRGAKLRYVNGLRVTDDAALACVKEAVGSVRVEIEAHMSMGLANTPMAGYRIRVASGNYVTARPLGVRDGVDYLHTGEVRRVDGDAIRQRLDDGAVVLVAPLGYSPTGEVFNLYGEDVAVAVARELQADKLLLLHERAGLNDSEGRLVRQMTTEQARRYLTEGGELSPDLRRLVRVAVDASNGGVGRVHILDRRIDGAILMELFTRDGVGTLVAARSFDTLRRATVDDVGGILELIEPMERDGTLVRRSRELLETEIDCFTVLEREGTVVACAALYPMPDAPVGELACLAVHGEYRGGGRGDQLLERVEQQARSVGLEALFVLTTRTAQWFQERGFKPAGLDDLPVSRRGLYNYQRGSRVYLKRLQSAPV
jgi:amino-acid N-acetyltransferase